MTELIKYNEACRAIAEAKSVDEAKEIRNKSDAVRAYAKQAKNKQLEVDAAEIRLRAERRLGELLQEQPKNPGTRTKGGGFSGGTVEGPPDNIPTLAEMGISKNLSSRSQKLAAVPTNKFEEQLTDWRNRVSKENERVTTNLIREGERQQKREDREHVSHEKREQFEQSDLSENVQIQSGDCLELAQELEPHSIDAIITDPPYPKEYLPEWEKLAEFAPRVLKPGGFCLTYSGKSHLPQVFHILTQKLAYFWQAILLHTGALAGVHPVKVNTGYKPILIFCNPPKRDLPEYWKDIIQGTGREKSDHQWQQAEQELFPLFDVFTEPNDLILDPFMGSGTTLVAGLQHHRRMIGFEREEDHIQSAWRRIYDLA